VLSKGSWHAQNRADDPAAARLRPDAQNPIGARPLKTGNAASSWATGLTGNAECPLDVGKRHRHLGRIRTDCDNCVGHDASEPVPVFTAVPKMWSPDEPVSRTTGTGFELPTRTSTVGRAPWEVPWPSNTVTGTVAGGRASGEPADVPTSPPSVSTPTMAMATGTFLNMEPPFSSVADH
jgi:hypothetical protein